MEKIIHINKSGSVICYTEVADDSAQRVIELHMALNPGNQSIVADDNNGFAAAEQQAGGDISAIFYSDIEGKFIVPAQPCSSPAINPSGQRPPN